MNIISQRSPLLSLGYFVLGVIVTVSGVMVASRYQEALRTSLSFSGTTKTQGRIESAALHAGANTITFTVQTKDGQTTEVTREVTVAAPAVPTAPDAAPALPAASDAPPNSVTLRPNGDGTTAMYKPEDGRIYQWHRSALGINSSTAQFYALLDEDVQLPLKEYIQQGIDKVIVAGRKFKETHPGRFQSVPLFLELSDPSPSFDQAVGPIAVKIRGGQSFAASPGQPISTGSVIITAQDEQTVLASGGFYQPTGDIYAVTTLTLQPTSANTAELWRGARLKLQFADYCIPGKTGCQLHEPAPEIQAIEVVVPYRGSSSESAAAPVGTSETNGAQCLINPADMILNPTGAGKHEYFSTGQLIPATIVMKNNGTSTWRAGKHRLAWNWPGVTEEFWGVGTTIELPVGTEVKPGEEYTFSFTATMPGFETKGCIRSYSDKYSCTMRWRMQEGSTFFGDTCTRGALVEHLPTPSPQ